MSDQPSGTSADATPTGSVPVVPPAQASPRVAPAATSPGVPPASAGTSSKSDGPERDWTWQVTDRVESVVGTVRDKTTVPITKISRIIVFGLVAAVVGMIALVLVLIALVRIIDVYLPFAPYGRRVWVGYAGLGAIFVLAGAFCWSKRTRKPQESTP